MLMVSLALVVAACSSNEPKADDVPVEEVVAEANSGDEQAEAGAETAEMSVEAKLEAAANGAHRSEKNRARNAYRHPVETLLFFGLEDDMQVVELWPGGGWYSEVLAPVLADQGKLVAGNMLDDPEDPEHYYSRIARSYEAWVGEHTDTLGEVEVGTFWPPSQVEVGGPESADMVLTFRSMHGWYRNGILNDVLAAAYDTLKPGGIFGVVQHRAAPGSNPDETAPLGYLPQDFVIEQVEAAGFELVESSEINANPKDTRDYEEGVWALPPSLRGGEEGAERFLEIGESDRMTLKFVKKAD
ncbi:methyltransferase [Lujinxingia litoralis]|uniref:Methyltransferase n=2 Tax=Lujinxingia litoralis TaxID=2211119 RepID=A0A328CAP1_9DELT|nr:methyltransferase [Lujinxingia litoralis]